MRTISTPHTLSARHTVQLLLLLGAVAALGPLSGCGDDGPQTCSATSDCSQGQACFSGICQTLTCSSSLECPTDAICYQPEGVCGRLQCRIDADCFSDRRNPYCVERRCVPTPPAECSVRADCGGAETCSEGECVGVLAGAACTTAEDCGNPQICVAGDAGRTCVDPCTSDDDCTEDDAIAVCVSDTGLCRAVECTLDEHCGEDRVCNDENECDLERFPCAELTCDDPARPFVTEPIDGLCRCVACFTDQNCDEEQGESCVSGGTCLLCESSGTSAEDCPEEAPFFEAGCCLECLNDDHCAAQFGVGSECLNGRCIPCDCNDDCECPDGVTCQIDDDDVGACLTGDGGLDDACTAQTDCGPGLACSYDRGVCVLQGAPEDGLCSPGCPSPARCASTGISALCYGCHDNDECPDGQTCQIQPEWADTYDGGACFPN